jgi:parvulin-like peptidyl-prolyl isomerase
MHQLQRFVQVSAVRSLALLLVISFMFGLLAPALPAFAQEATPAAIPTDGPPPEGPITTVNGVSQSAAEFQDRVRLTRFLYAYTIRETLRALVEQGTPTQNAFNAVQQFYSVEINRLVVPDLLADAVLDTMEEDAVLAQYAEVEGIEVTDADIDARILDFVNQANIVVGTDPEATPEPDATEEPSADLVAAMIAEATERTGISEDIIRAYFRAQTVRNKVTDFINGPFPTEWPLLSLRHILVETEDAANEVLARLEAGEDFATVAQEVSIDTVSGAQGGTLPPAIPEVYVGPFADAVRDAEVGAILGPVASEFGFHIIEVTDRTVQAPDEAARRALLRTRNTAFRTWLDEQVAAATVQRESTWPEIIPNQPNGRDLLQSMIESM